MNDERTDLDEPEGHGPSSTSLRVIVICALFVLVGGAFAVDAWWPASAQDKRVAQIKKDCYDKMSADAYNVIAARGYPPTQAQQVDYVLNCETSQGITP